MKNKFAFLILHYVTSEETIKSVESIQKLNYKNYDIVIVDNGSPNNTGIILEKLYENERNIHVILSKKNLGFANGNNLGFKYIKEKLKSDFIVMMNNDVYITQEDFNQKIIDEYKKSKFAVLGPKIILRDNIICAYPDKIFSIDTYKKILRDRILFYTLNKYHLRYLYSIKFHIKEKLKKKIEINTSIRKENVLLNGSCLIFSKEYINKFDGIDDRTFLYYEEPLLFIRIEKNNLKSIYNPEIEIFHDESVSTNKAIKNKRRKNDFKLKHEIESLRILIKEMEK